MRTLPMPIYSDSTVKEPHGMCYIRSSQIILHRYNEWSSQSTKVIKYRFFSSVGFAKFLFCFFCLQLFFFSEVHTTDSWNKDEYIKYRTEPTFRYLIDGIRYFFSIPNTDVGIGIVFLSIGYRFGILRPRWSCYRQNVLTFWILFRSNVVSSAKTEKKTEWQPPTYIYGEKTLTIWSNIFRYTTSIRHGQKSDTVSALHRLRVSGVGMHVGPSISLANHRMAFSCHSHKL